MPENKGYLSPAELTKVLGGITVQGVYKIMKNLEVQTNSLGSRSKLIPPKEVRRIFTSKGFSYQKKNISFQIVKGGVGKTSLSHLLITRASHYGARILAVDADQQGNLTKALGVAAREQPVLINMVRDGSSVSDGIIKVDEQIDLIPSNLNNSRLDLELTQANPNLGSLIGDILQPIRDNYDLVIIDCPPAINKINTAVTCSSDLVIIPINPDPYALDGLQFTLSELKQVKKNFRAKFDYKIVWNKYDARERLGAYYLHDLAKDEELIQHLLPVVIGVDASVRNATHEGISVFETRKKSTIREDADQFTKEILGLNSWAESLGVKKNALEMESV